MREAAVHMNEICTAASWWQCQQCNQLIGRTSKQDANGGQSQVGNEQNPLHEVIPAHLVAALEQRLASSAPVCV